MRPERRWLFWLILPAAAALIILREPHLVREPHFYAEEGAIYFCQAWKSSFWAALAAPHQGYYTLVPNLFTALAAKLVPLERAPLVTSLAALLVNLVPLAWIATSRTGLLAGAPRKIAAALIILFVAGGKGFYLNTIMSQYHLAALAFLILVELAADGPTRRRIRWGQGLLLLCGLGSPAACFLTPLAALEAWRRRRARLWVAAGLLGACCAVQAAANLATPKEGSEQVTTLGSRLAGLDPALAVSVVASTAVVERLAGPELARSMREEIVKLEHDRGVRFWTVMALVALGLAAFLMLAAWHLPAADKRLYIGAFLLLSGPSLALSFGSQLARLQVGTDERYLYASTVVLLLTLLAGVRPGDRFWTRVAPLFCGGLLVAGLVFGHLSQCGDVSDHSAWSRWEVEVARFRASPSYVIRIWPAGWVLPINDAGAAPAALGIEGRVRELGAPASPDDSGLPTLRVSRPVLGRNMEVDVRTSRPRSRGRLGVSEHPARPRKMTLPRGIEATSYLPAKERKIRWVEFETDDEGRWHYAIPPAGLGFVEGWTICFQAVTLAPIVELTNAVEVVVGSR